MSNIQSSPIQVEWHLSTHSAPHLCVPCSHCGHIRSFRSSDKARLNANGKRLDAWLIYHCTICGNSWNRTIFERRPVSTIKPDIMEALQSNNSIWLQRFASDPGELAKLGVPIENSAELSIRRRIISVPIYEPDILQINIVVAAVQAVRLDRLLSQELNVSRNQVLSLARDNILTLDCGNARRLKKPIRQTMGLRLDLCATALRDRILGHILGQI